MLGREKLDKIRLEGDFSVETMEIEAKEIAAREVAEIQRKSKILSNKMHDLHRKKINTLRSPRPKAEILELAKAAHKENRRRFLFDELLVPFLKIAQQQRFKVLSFDDIRLPIDPLRVAYCIFTEEEIIKAVEALPDGGLSQSEIELEVQKLDKEIEALKRRVKEEVGR